MSGPHDGGSPAACSEGSSLSSGSPAASNPPAFRASEEGIQSYASPTSWSLGRLLRSQGLEKGSPSLHCQPHSQNRTTGHDSHKLSESGQEAGRRGLSLQPQTLSVELLGRQIVPPNDV